jgi:hypothetical protein
MYIAGCVIMYTDCVSETNYIWTNHVLQRLKERKIAKDLLVRTLTFPDKTIRKDHHTTEFQKRIDDRTVAVIVKKNDQDENIIVSCWVNPPFPGTKDFRRRSRYQQIQKAHGLKKFWLAILYQLDI